MAGSYRNELERLKHTAAFFRDMDVGPVANLLADITSKNLIFVGSGGSFTAATFGAALHEEYAGKLAKAVTPLEAATRAATDDTGAVLLSARGSNPDILKAYRSVCLKEPVIAICATEQNQLLRQISASGAGSGFGFKVPGGKDGFLATNSLLATLIVLAKSYALLFGRSDAELDGIGEPTFKDENQVNGHGNVRHLKDVETIVALSSNWGWAAAVDFESKCSESGLPNVQVVDYRNFAHGRHNWLTIRGETTAIVSFEEPSNSSLAQSTLELIPDDVRKIRLVSTKHGAASAVDLVGLTMHFAGALGEESGIDLGRPKIAAFGRKMYRKGFASSRPASIRQAWISRKAEAMGLLPNQHLDVLPEALDTFLARLERASINAIVVDYDGTLCETTNRHGGVSRKTGEAINGLLRNGMAIGVATGRGRSAHNDLRRVVESAYWDNVLMGLHHGTMISPLNENVAASVDSHNPKLDAALSVLESNMAKMPIKITRNEHLISLIPEVPLPLTNLHRSVIELLDEIVPPGQVRKSGHSIDILYEPYTKANVVTALEQFAGCDSDSILRIGDLGNWFGNDFHLLNTGLSLSVDQVSSRLDTCWNLGLPSSKGVKTTEHYLSALRPIDGRFIFDVDELEPRHSRKAQ